MLRAMNRPPEIDPALSFPEQQTTAQEFVIVTDFLCGFR